MTCNECGVIIDPDTDWIMLTVNDDGSYVTGFLCTTDCLVDYVADVKAMEADSEHPRWWKD